LQALVDLEMEFSADDHDKVESDNDGEYTQTWRETWEDK
jgi:hypothetical protein